jgi:ABC-type Fe3+/spermidine/putrescine transport system ATPase subunit
VAEFVGRVNLIEGEVASADSGRVVMNVTGSHHRLAVSSDGASVSGTVTVAVRPEAVTLVAADDRSVNGTNTWDASVRAVAFLGDHYEYELDAGAIALTVQSSRLVEGDRIRVHIPPEACTLVGR